MNFRLSKTILFLSMIPLFCLTLRAQSDLPRMGQVSDLMGMKKVYVVADTLYRPSILKRLAKSDLSVVDDPSDADFFIEYKIASEYQSTNSIHITIGQMDAYRLKDKKKLLAWSATANGAGFRKDMPTVLTEKLLKALDTK